MTETHFQSVVRGNLEAIEQAIGLVENLKSGQYTAMAKPHSSSSIGAHLRHVIDMFRSAFDGLETGTIDYDARRRGAAVETQRDVAIAELKELHQKISEISPSQGKQVVNVKSEVTLSNQAVAEISSTLVRELVFTASHAVHHFALIKMIASLQGCVVDGNLGVAPATATFLREAQS